MKMFLVLVLSVTALFLWQRKGENDAAGRNKPTVKKIAAAPASRRPVYQHDWAKNSLNRAHEVADEVRQTRQQKADEDR